MGMDEFYTSDKADEGKKLPLFFVGGGKSDHWLLVRNQNSEIFRRADLIRLRRYAVASQIENEEKQAQAYLDAETDAVAALIAGWSFDEECTRKAAINFLKKAPQNIDAVNKYAARDADFFGKESDSLPGGSSQKSD